MSEKPLAPPKTAFAPVQNGVAPVQEAFRRPLLLGPKDLLHAPLSTFGNFPFSVSFPGPQLPNPRPTRWGTSRPFRPRFPQKHCDTYVRPGATQNLVVKFDGDICGGVLVENASDDFPQQVKLENLLPNFAGSSPPISPKTSPTSLWKSLVLTYVGSIAIQMGGALRCDCGKY